MAKVAKKNDFFYYLATFFYAYLSVSEYKRKIVYGMENKPAALVPPKPDISLRKYFLSVDK